MFNLDIENLPEDKEVYKNIYAKGNTNGIFQFESKGMKNMLKDFQPECFEDIVLLIATYRPGPMKFIPSIIKVKRKEEIPEYVIPEMEEVLGVTYGYPVYQEQIMQIFNKFAGFTLGEADTVRRYMSKKKVEKFLAYKDKFIEGLIERGAEKEKAEAFWDTLEDFSKYAFNKSHAAAYAKVSYMTAYLKYHHPAEFVVATANNVPFDKITNILVDAKRSNLVVLPPDINKSSNDFILENGRIRYGLSQIKGVASSSNIITSYRDAHGDFSSIDDIIKLKIDKGALSSLIDAGCLDFLYPTENRKTIAKIVERKKTEYDEVIKYEEKIQEGKEILSILQKGNTPGTNYKYYKSFDEDKISLAIDKSRNLLSTAKRIYENQDFEYERIEDLKEDKLAREEIVLGLVLTEKIMQGLSIPANCESIADVKPGNNKNICGVIKSSHIHIAKSGMNAGKEMLYLTIEDDTDTIDCIMYPQDYARNKIEIQNGLPITLNGNIQTKNGTNQMIIKTINLLKQVDKIVIINARNIANVYNLQNYLLAYKSDKGIQIVFQTNDSPLQDYKYLVSEDALKDEVVSKFEMIQK